MGLKALLGSIGDERPRIPTEITEEASITHEIPLDQISTNPDQPRKHFNKDSLEELAESIKNYGLVQPITLQKTSEEEYVIVAGERRYRAFKMLNKPSIPAYVREPGDEKLLALALIENIQREDLNPVEIALSYRRLMEEYGITQEALADRVGKKRSTISNYIRLLKLPPEIIQSLKMGRISMGHARVIAGIDDIVRQLQVFRKVTTEGLSVRKTEELANLTVKQISPRAPHVSRQDPDMKRVADKLSATIGAKVHITQNHKGAGQILIRFDSTETLNQILDIFEELD